MSIYEYICLGSESKHIYSVFISSGNSTKSCFYAKKRVRITFETNIFLAIWHNLKEDCPASVAYKALGIPLLIQTPLLPPRYSLLPAICIHLHDFTMCISFVLTVWWCKRNPPYAALLHGPLKATWILHLKTCICFNYKLIRGDFRKYQTHPMVHQR